MKKLKNSIDMGFKEINHKIDMKVKTDCQVIISPLLQSMLGFRQAIFPAREYVSDWVADVKKGLNYLYVYCPFVEPLSKRLVIGCVDSDAINRTIMKITFDFKHYKINVVAMNVDGQQIPAKPTLKTQIIFAVIWDSMPVRGKRCIKTKKIPSPERNTLKKTPYLDSI